jgi:hypothetical protein
VVLHALRFHSVDVGDLAADETAVVALAGKLKEYLFFPFLLPFLFNDFII